MFDLQIQEYLKEKGVRPSLHRIMIMKYLLEHRTHPTVDDIYNDLHANIPTLSKTTIYNTLKLLVEKGAAVSLAIDEKNVRYDGITEPHAHFRCVKCERIFDIPIDESINFANSHLKNFRLLETQVIHRGYCSECNKKMDN
ncbi:MAG: transcriptional repressor [Bacteroidales bacterium]|nr:transcriptional repressor [Bacteroidales bacterium]